MVARVYHHYLVWERCYSKGLEVVRNVGPPQLGPALKPPNTQMEESRYRIGHLSFFRFYLRLHVIWFTTYKLIIQYTIPGEPIRRFFFLGCSCFLVEDQKFLKDTLLVSYVCALVLFFVLWCRVFGFVSPPSLRHVFGWDQKQISNGGRGIYIYMYVYTL